MGGWISKCDWVTRAIFLLHFAYCCIYVSVIFEEEIGVICKYIQGVLYTYRVSKMVSEIRKRSNLWNRKRFLHGRKWPAFASHFVLISVPFALAISCNLGGTVPVGRFGQKADTHLKFWSRTIKQKVWQKRWNKWYFERCNSWFLC